MILQTLPWNLEILYVNLSIKTKNKKKNKSFKRKVFEKKKNNISFQEVNGSYTIHKLYNSEHRKTNNFRVGILAGISQCRKLLQLFCTASAIFIFLIYYRMCIIVYCKIFLHYFNMLNYISIIFSLLFTINVKIIQDTDHSNKEADCKLNI